MAAAAKVLPVPKNQKWVGSSFGVSSENPRIPWMAESPNRGTIPIVFVQSAVLHIRFTCSSRDVTQLKNQEPKQNAQVLSTSHKHWHHCRFRYISSTKVKARADCERLVAHPVFSHWDNRRKSGCTSTWHDNKQKRPQCALHTWQIVPNQLNFRPHITQTKNKHGENTT
jgi:hypothetical protein